MREDDEEEEYWADVNGGGVRSVSFWVWCSEHSDANTWANTEQSSSMFFPSGYSSSRRMRSPCGVLSSNWYLRPTSLSFVMTLAEINGISLRLFLSHSMNETESPRNTSSTTNVSTSVARTSTTDVSTSLTRTSGPLQPNSSHYSLVIIHVVISRV